MKCEICGRELQQGEDHRNCIINDYAKCVYDMDYEIKVYKKAFELSCNKLAEIFGDCPYGGEIDFEYCSENCDKEMERYLCFDRYYLDKAREELEKKYEKTNNTSNN